MSFNLGNGLSVTDPNYSSELNYQMFDTASGFPSTVDKYEFSWTWRVAAVDGTPRTPETVGTTTGHILYTLLDSPDSFYFKSYEETGVPWTDVLDLACDWASEETSYSACMSKLTQSLYDYSELKYTPSDSGHGAGNMFYLQKLLNDINAQSPTFANCVAYANFLNILAYSIGIPQSVAGYIQLKANFATKTILPAQWANPDSFNWGLHQIVNFYDETQWADRIADAAAKVYDNGGLILAKGDMAYNDYLPKLTDDGSVYMDPASVRVQTWVYIVP